MNPAERADLLEVARGRVADFRRLQDAGLLRQARRFLPLRPLPPDHDVPPDHRGGVVRDLHHPADRLFDVYAHIPFCKQRCIFCHYPVKYGDQVAEKDRYLAALEKEMDLYMRRWARAGSRPARSWSAAARRPISRRRQLKRFLEYFTRAARHEPVPAVQLRRRSDDADRAGRAGAAADHAGLRRGPADDRRAVAGRRRS